jgi:hypothetical protein
LIVTDFLFVLIQFMGRPPPAAAIRPMWITSAPKKASAKNAILISIIVCP